MDFSYSEEQRDVRQLAQQILGDQTSNEQLRVIDALDARFDEKLWADLAAAGLLGIDIEERFGGMGFGFETLCLLVEEAGRTVAPVPVIPTLVSAASTLQRHAGASLCEAWLPGVVRGEHLVTAALVEPGSEDPRAPATAAAERDGQFTLNGTKHCVPFAAQAAAVLVTARHGESTGMFLVDLADPGVSLQRQFVTSGEPQYEVSLAGVPAQPVAVGNAADAALDWLCQATTVATAAMATGLCDAMLRLTASYTSERQQFGVQIATFQAVGHRAADCFIDIECLRLVSQRAVSLLDQGSEAAQAVHVAKAWTGDVCHRVSQASQHLHGGIGVDRDYPLFRFCLWARQLELNSGGSASSLAALGKAIATDFAA